MLDLQKWSCGSLFACDFMNKKGVVFRPIMTPAKNISDLPEAKLKTVLKQEDGSNG